jgi:hypothetical protein
MKRLQSVLRLALALSYFVLAPPAEALGAQANIAVFVVQFLDSQPATLCCGLTVPGAVQSTMERVNAYYARQSYGVLVPTSDVFGIYTLPLVQASATRADIARESKLAAANEGVDLSKYTRWIYISPMASDAIAAGSADGSGAWIGSPFNSLTVPSWDHVAHELGHHLGYFSHEYGVRCELSGSCSVKWFGNVFSIMGSGTGDFSAQAKVDLGWLAQPQLTTSSGDYDIEPLETAPEGGVKMIRFRGGPKGAYTFAIEYRPSGGVLLYRIGPSGTLTTLLQATPYVAGTQQSHALPVGQTYCDKDGRVSVKVLSASSIGATVKIKYGGKCL